jgi:cathepsin A (carboxypeptidase C)
MAGATQYLNNKTVQAAIGVNAITWAPCNDQVNGMFSHDWMKNFHMDIVPLMAANISAILYSGDCDFICNWCVSYLPYWC